MKPKLSSLTFCLTLITSLHDAAGQQGTNWQNPSFGDWHIASNWSHNIPTASTEVFIRNGGTALLNAPAQTGNLLVGVPSCTTACPSNGALLATGSADLQLGGVLRVGVSLGSGYPVSGAVTISSGGRLQQTLGHTLIGGGPYGSDGTLTVTDPNSSIATSTSLTVGAGTSRGTLNVQNGAVATTAGPAAIGSTSFSTGSVNVTGANSRWQSSDGIFVGGGDTGAPGGNATLRILNGGKVQAPLLKQYSTAFVEVDNGSATAPGLLITGTTYAPVAGGALGDIAIGNSGTGRMEITAGGTAYSNRGYIGFSSGSTGAVLLTGTNSRWNCNGSVWVGNGGDGTLELASNAQLHSAGHGYIGSAVGSVGSASVSGGARWNIAGTLFIGGNASGPGGSGTVIMQGGTVNAAAYVIHHSGGIGLGALENALNGTNDSPAVPMTIDGGFVQALTWSYFDNDCTVGAGGVRFYTNGFYIGASGRLTGPGGLEKGGGYSLGAGELLLSGVSDYTGPTTVTSGTLIVAGSITSPVTLSAGGELRGAGTVGSVTVGDNGVMRPGDANIPSEMQVNGDYTQTSGGSFETAIGGVDLSGSDIRATRIKVTGSANLNGKLKVTRTNGYSPTVGETFPIISSNGVNGTFSSIETRGFTVRADTYPDGVVLTVTSVSAVPLVSVTSRKTHAGAGAVDVILSQNTADPAVECRTGGSSGQHTIVFTFANRLTHFETFEITDGVGTYSIAYINGHQFVVNLTGVTNAQNIGVRVTHLNDEAGNSSPVVAASMGVLLGDANGDGTVNSGDAQQTRNRSGQATSATNFRSDFNLDGTINSGDATVVRSRSGQFIP